MAKKQQKQGKKLKVFVILAVCLIAGLFVAKTFLLKDQKPISVPQTATTGGSKPEQVTTQKTDPPLPQSDRSPFGS
jgi:hypothetical protein